MTKVKLTVALMTAKEVRDYLNQFDAQTKEAEQPRGFQEAVNLLVDRHLEEVARDNGITVKEMQRRAIKAIERFKAGDYLQ